MREMSRGMVRAFGCRKVYTVSIGWLVLNNTVQAADIFHRKLCEDYPEAGLRVYMNGDGSDVYEDAFRKIAVSSNGTFHPTLVLLGVRLGIDRVTPVYWEALKATLQMKQSVGIAGYPLHTCYGLQFVHLLIFL